MTTNHKAVFETFFLLTQRSLARELRDVERDAVQATQRTVWAQGERATFPLGVTR